MKINTILFGIFGIGALNVYAKSLQNVYDVVQTSDFQENDIQRYTQSDYAQLKDNHCYVEGGFSPKHDDVSQVRVLFPTESLQNVWGNNSFNIGFSVQCGSYSNTNLYKFSDEHGMKLNPDLKYTRFSMDVGKCRRPFLQGGSRHIDHIEIFFMLNDGKNRSKMTLQSREPKAAPNSMPSLGSECGHINNFKTFYIPRVPVNASDGDLNSL